MSGDRIEQRADLVLPIGSDSSVLDAQGWGTYPASLGIAGGESGCLGFQVDTPTSSQLIVVEYAPK